MHKISAIFSGILFLLGCMSLGIALFLPDVLYKIFTVYLMAHPSPSYEVDILYVNSKYFCFLAVAELVLGAVGYFYHYKKSE